MDAQHWQHRYYQGRSHGYYNQYQPQPGFNETSSWSLWRDYPPPVDHPRPHSPRRWWNILVAVVVFLIILAVMIIAGLAIYMGALKLENSQYLMLDGSFRVVSGDSYNTSLADNTSDLFHRKSNVYKLLIESILRRSDLGLAVKQCSVLGFTNGSLVVFFRLILDRRKIQKKSTTLEERVRALLLQGVSTASPLKNFKIDKTQVHLKRVGHDSSHPSLLEELGNRNHTIDVHNGLLRKGPPQIVTAHHPTVPTDRRQLPKTTAEYDGVIEGSFKLSTPPSLIKDKTTSPPISNAKDRSETSSQRHQTSQIHNDSPKKSMKSDNVSTFDFYQHSPALNALLMQKPKTEKVTEQTVSAESTESIVQYGDTDLITLLPFVFQGQEEAWKPILPENFTRYPERRPFVTENYNSEGVGIAEVVLEPDDLSSSVSSKTPGWNNIDRISHIPLHTQEETHTNTYSHEQSSSSPKKDQILSYLVNTEPEKSEDGLDQYYKVHGDIYTKQKNANEVRGNVHSLGDFLPDFPIIQQFHNLDSLLRSYSMKTSSAPVTLLPARSNLDIRKKIRPKPFQAPGVTQTSQPTEDPQVSDSVSKVVKNQILLEISSLQGDNSEKRKNVIVMQNTSNHKNSDSSQIEGNTFEDQTDQSSGSSKGETNGKISVDTTEHEELQTTTELLGLNVIGTEKTSSDNPETPPTLTPVDPSVGTLHIKDANQSKEDSTTITSMVLPGTMVSRNHRQSKMSFPLENDTATAPVKFNLQDDANQTMLNASEEGRNSLIEHQPIFIIKLKDTKMQELLEKIIFNMTLDVSGMVSPSEHDLDKGFSIENNSNSNLDIDTNVVHNRKFAQGTSDSKNGLVKNSSIFEMKPDNILFYLKHLKNDSSLNLHGESYSNTYSNKDGLNKSSPNYVMNKDGFLMLTKIYNKASTSKPETDTESLKKFNTTTNHTLECSGTMSVKCGSGECISSLSRCNHLVDCVDGSDEKNCTCAEFLRAQYLTRKICDGVVDCWDFSDENTCEWCSAGQHVCASSRLCVDRHQVCDGHNDCPNGDDERNCVFIAPNISQADSMTYYSSGTLMIRKEGHWGKLCTQNFESLSSIFNSKWTLDDLGKVVCKTMTFKTFNSIEHVNDESEDGNQLNQFYELLYSKDPVQQYSSRLGLTFGNTDCSEKKVVRVSCSDLECGIRPQASPQWGRKKRVAGSRHSRIVGGGNAGPGAWPWLAALYKEGEFQCGATLISDQWLLSAGHCFYHALEDYWVARLGALRRGTNLPSPYEQLRVVSRILLHPHYVDTGFINDISLLQLEQPVSLTNYVRPICLPQPSAVLRDGTMCTVIGWGQLFEVGRIFPDTLQEVQLPVISTAECRKRTLFLPLYKVTENMFCAGYDRGGRDACLGDSGGPLMCQEGDGHWTLMGVTSNGYGCARANRPGVYTKVANYVSWVTESTGPGAATGGRNITCHGHRCPLGECLPPARICNGFMECSDASDEADCW